MEKPRSQTAESVAFRRAFHVALDPPPVLDDPLAARIVGATPEALEAARPREQIPLLRALRAFLVARSRFAEDLLAQAVTGGVRQYLLLGAGLDTFAYRNPHPGLRVFEVDQPASQAFKRERLAAAGIAIPPSLTLVPVDFERQALATELPRAGFDPAAPAFVAWLGVTLYLTREAVLETLAWIARLAPGSAVVFDFSPPRSTRSSPAFDLLSSRVAAKGEPWITFFEPEELEQALRSLGFAGVELASADTLNARYFQDRPDGLRVLGESRIALARI